MINKTISSSKLTAALFDFPRNLSDRQRIHLLTINIPHLYFPNLEKLSERILSTTLYGTCGRVHNPDENVFHIYENPRSVLRLGCLNGLGHWPMFDEASDRLENFMKIKEISNWKKRTTQNRNVGLWRLTKKMRFCSKVGGCCILKDSLELNTVAFLIVWMKI